MQMRYLLGPELLWLLIYGVAVLLAKANVPPTKAIDNFIDKTWFCIPLLALLTFSLWWIPQVEKNWLLLRTWMACIVGGHFALEKMMSTYSTQGPGSGMGYLAGMIFIFIALAVGTLILVVGPQLKKIF